MKNRSAPGNSTPTWRLIKVGSLALAGRVWLGFFLVVLAAVYVIAGFTAPNPILRIVLRCLPVVPAAIWTLWFDQSRPFQEASILVRTAARVCLLTLIIAFAVALLGIGLNWLYDPNRFV